jgi:peptidoglycan hydrolase-like protein with peptidoglycan-binding domain
MIALCAALLLVPAGLLPTPGEARADARPAAVPADWPVPVPTWFWEWARWYLGRAAFATAPPRSPATRPDAAPRLIPAWAWHRLAVIDGARAERGRMVARTWPLPVPAWFWSWAQWRLGRGPYHDEPARSAASRPGAAPRFIPPWAWQRLTVLRDGTWPTVPTAPLRPGATGKDVRTLQAALHAARYAGGALDGVYGAHTRDAVVAFELLHGLRPDGVVQPHEYLRIVRTVPPAPPLAGRRYLYVDLDHQVLLGVRNGRVATVTHVSSGGGYVYTARDGTQQVATTPMGDYRVYRKVRGWDDSYLGRLYDPSYYSGGYAIHGSSNVPVTPASHGCVRVPLWLARSLFRHTAIGTPVFVRGS